MFKVEKVGGNHFIMEYDARDGRIALAVVRVVPGALERVQYLCDAANRDEERLVERGVEVVQGILDRKQAESKTSR